MSDSVLQAVTNGCVSGLQRRRGTDKWALRQLRRSAAAPFAAQSEDDDEEADDTLRDFFPQRADAGEDAVHSVLVLWRNHPGAIDVMAVLNRSKAAALQHIALKYIAQYCRQHR